jgi:hypothetical protein
MIFRRRAWMIRKTVLTLLYMLIACIAFPADTADIKMVIGSRLTYSMLIGSCVIEFNKNGTYEANYESEGLYWHNKGDYSVKNNKILLAPAVCKSYKNDERGVPCETTLGRAECAIIEDLKSLYYTRYLECTSLDNKNVLGFNSPGILFPLPQFRIKSGEERVFKGTRVIVLPDSNGVTTSNVKIRKSPSISSESVQYMEKMAYDPTSKTLDFVPRDTRITIIARTKDKYSVDKWSNYWFLVSVGMQTEVWMFGEFVKLK